MDRFERIAEALKTYKIEDSVEIDGRKFVGPDDAMARLRELEEIARALQSIDPLALYDRTYAFDGIFREDIHGSGRFYAYLKFELKGVTPEEKDATITQALSGLAERFGKDSLVALVPRVIDGRQVTENLTVRPEIDEFPSYFSKTRTAYAEKMAADELPKGILAPIKSLEEKILDEYSWTTVFVSDAGGVCVDICGNTYVLSQAETEDVSAYGELWTWVVGDGFHSLYDIEIAIDGEYPQDEQNETGRYFAYVKAVLKGLNSEERRAGLAAAVPGSVMQKLGGETVFSILPETMSGDLVTPALTIRPEADDYPSYFKSAKIESGKERIRKQVLFNLQAEILANVNGRLQDLKKVVILN